MVLLVVPLAAPLGVLAAVVVVLQVVVVDLVVVGRGSSIPVVCSILPKLVYNLAVLLVDLCKTPKCYKEIYPEKN